MLASSFFRTISRVKSSNIFQSFYNMNHRSLSSNRKFYQNSPWASEKRSPSVIQGTPVTRKKRGEVVDKEESSSEEVKEGPISPPIKPSTVPYSYLKVDFVEYCGGIHQIGSKTTKQVFEEILKPKLIAPFYSSIQDLSNFPLPTEKTPIYYCHHDLDAPFVETLQQLENYFKQKNLSPEEEKEIQIYLDPFTNFLPPGIPVKELLEKIQIIANDHDPAVDPPAPQMNRKGEKEQMTKKPSPTVKGLVLIPSSYNLQLLNDRSFVFYVFRSHARNQLHQIEIIYPEFPMQLTYERLIQLIPIARDFLVRLNVLPALVEDLNADDRKTIEMFAIYAAKKLKIMEYTQVSLLYQQQITSLLLTPLNEQLIKLENSIDAAPVEKEDEDHSKKMNKIAWIEGKMFFSTLEGILLSKDLVGLTNALTSPTSASSQMVLLTAGSNDVTLHDLEYMKSRLGESHYLYKQLCFYQFPKMLQNFSNNFDMVRKYFEHYLSPVLIPKNQEKQIISTPSGILQIHPDITIIDAFLQFGERFVAELNEQDLFLTEIFSWIDTYYGNLLDWVATLLGKEHLHTMKVISVYLNPYFNLLLLYQSSLTTADDENKSTSSVTKRKNAFPTSSKVEQIILQAQKKLEEIYHDQPINFSSLELQRILCSFYSLRATHEKPPTNVAPNYYSTFARNYEQSMYDQLLSTLANPRANLVFNDGTFSALMSVIDQILSKKTLSSFLTAEKFLWFCLPYLSTGRQFVQYAERFPLIDESVSALVTKELKKDEFPAELPALYPYRKMGKIHVDHVLAYFDWKNEQEKKKRKKHENTPLPPPQEELPYYKEVQVRKGKPLQKEMRLIGRIYYQQRRYDFAMLFFRAYYFQLDQIIQAMHEEANQFVVIETKELVENPQRAAARRAAAKEQSQIAIDQEEAIQFQEHLEKLVQECLVLRVATHSCLVQIKEELKDIDFAKDCLQAYNLVKEKMPKEAEFATIPELWRYYADVAMKENRTQEAIQFLEGLHRLQAPFSTHELKRIDLANTCRDLANLHLENKDYLRSKLYHDDAIGLYSQIFPKSDELLTIIEALKTSLIKVEEEVEKIRAAKLQETKENHEEPAQTIEPPRLEEANRAGELPHVEEKHEEPAQTIEPSRLEEVNRAGELPHMKEKHEEPTQTIEPSRLEEVNRAGELPQTKENHEEPTQTIEPSRLEERNGAVELQETKVANKEESSSQSPTPEIEEVNEIPISSPIKPSTVPYSYLKENFVEHCGGIHQIGSKTTKQVFEEILKPKLIAPFYSSIQDLSNFPLPTEKTPIYYCHHDLDAPFVETLQQLENYFKQKNLSPEEEKEIQIYLDPFTNFLSSEVPLKELLEKIQIIANDHDLAVPQAPEVSEGVVEEIQMKRKPSPTVKGLVLIPSSYNLQLLTDRVFLFYLFQSHARNQLHQIEIIYPESFIPLTYEQLIKMIPIARDFLSQLNIFPTIVKGITKDDPETKEMFRKHLSEQWKMKIPELPLVFQQQTASLLLNSFSKQLIQLENAMEATSAAAAAAAAEMEEETEDRKKNKIAWIEGKLFFSTLEGILSKNVINFVSVNAASPPPPVPSIQLSFPADFKKDVTIHDLEYVKSQLGKNHVFSQQLSFYLFPQVLEDFSNDHFDVVRRYFDLYLSPILMPTNNQEKQIISTPSGILQIHPDISIIDAFLQFGEIFVEELYQQDLLLNEIFSWIDTYYGNLLHWVATLLGKEHLHMMKVLSVYLIHHSKLLQDYQSCLEKPTGENNSAAADTLADKKNSFPTLSKVERILVQCQKRLHDIYHDHQPVTYGLIELQKLFLRFDSIRAEFEKTPTNAVPNYYAKIAVKYEQSIYDQLLNMLANPTTNFEFNDITFASLMTLLDRLEEKNTLSSFQTGEKFLWFLLPHLSTGRQLVQYAERFPFIDERVCVLLANEGTENEFPAEIPALFPHRKIRRINLEHVLTFLEDQQKKQQRKVSSDRPSATLPLFKELRLIGRIYYQQKEYDLAALYFHAYYTQLMEVIEAMKEEGNKFHNHLEKLIQESLEVSIAVHSSLIQMKEVDRVKQRFETFILVKEKMSKEAEFATKPELWRYYADVAMKENHTQEAIHFLEGLHRLQAPFSTHELKRIDLANTCRDLANLHLENKDYLRSKLYHDDAIELYSQVFAISDELLTIIEALKTSLIKVEEEVEKIRAAKLQETK